MKKYLLLAVLALAAFGMVFTGCDSGSSWEPEDDYGKTVTVTFDANGMGTAPAPMQTRVGNFIWLPKMASENDFVHVSWYKDKARQYSAGNVEDRFYPEDDITLYAYWTDQKYAVQWDINYALNAGEKPIVCDIVAAGTKVVKKGDLSKRDDGTEFAGWFTDKEVTPEIQPVTTDIIVDSDKTFYAQWKVPVTVKWMVNGQEYTDGVQQQSAFTKLKLPTTVPAPVGGNVFGGWYTAEAGGDTVDENTMVYNAVTYYAQFGYKITLYDGSTEVGIAGITDGGKFISGVTASKAGYTIVGYYTDSSYTQMLAGPDMTLLPDIENYTDEEGRYTAADTTLYIKWGQKMAGIIYYADQTHGYGKDNYAFYDKNGRALYVEEADYSVTFYTDSAKTAKAEVAYYDVTGKTDADKDRYYAAGTKLTKGYPWTFGQSDAAVTASNHFTQELQSVLGGNPLHSKKAGDYQGTGYLGRGKGDTKTIMENKPIPGVDSNSYVTGVFSKTGTTYIEKYPDIWYMLADYRTTTGIDDWFIPSASELWLLTKNTDARLATGWMSDAVWSSSVQEVIDYASWAVGTDGSISNVARCLSRLVVPVRAF